MKKPKILLMYHFFYPDNVVSATHYTQFATGLQKKGWEVHVLTSNRHCRHPQKTITTKYEQWQGIHIHRTYRPAGDQGVSWQRLINSFWLMMAWCLKLFTLPKFDVIVMGSDPAFCPLIYPFIKWTRRSTTLAHWCYDLYPEAIEANGLSKKARPLLNLAYKLMGWAYKPLDLMVDLGSCMRDRLKRYNLKCRQETLVPWAFAESNDLTTPDTQTRQKLFGSSAKLTLLYAGSMGLAHKYQNFLALARSLRNNGHDDISFCFAGHGNRFEELKAQVTPEDTNIHFAGFASIEELPKRLNAADIHLLSIKKDWSGIVLPSKFFGSLAVGKPVLYDGPKDSAVAGWITEHGIGFSLTDDSIEDTAQKLIEYSQNPDKLKTMSQKALSTYKQQFSYTHVVNEWDRVLREILQAPNTTAETTVTRQAS